MADLSKTFVREIEIFECSLNVHQAYIGDVGCVVWDAALVLSKYLEKARKEDLKNKKVLELGAGTGIVSLCCSLAGAEVICTDLVELQPLIELNMKVNESQLKGKFEYCELKWGENLTSFNSADFLVMSDVIYYEESLLPLTDTICHLAGENTEVIVSYEDRHDGNKPYLKQQFFEILDKEFVIHTIPEEEQDPVFHSSDIHIVSMTKRKKYDSSMPA